MDNSDVLQRNADGKLEVRVVNGTEKADAPANYDDVFTVNTEGKRALRVVGAGGGGGGTGTVTSVNGVQPVDGNVEITGDNITATVGEEEATITQHLTALKNQQYPYPEDSEFTVVTLPQTAPSNWYRLKLSASVDENATTAIPDGIYGYYAYVKSSYLQSEDSWAEYGKTYAFIKFSVKGGKFSKGEFGGQDLLFVPYIPKQFFTTTATESQITFNESAALANISFDQTAASIIDNKIILAPDYADDGVFGTASAGGPDSRLEAGFTPIRNLETGAELVTSGELVTDIDWDTQDILYGTPSPYKTQVSIPAFPNSSIVSSGIDGQGIVGFDMSDNHASIKREFIVVLTKVTGDVVQAYKIRGDGGRATCLQMGGTPAKLYVKNTGSNSPGSGYEFWIDNRELQADRIYVSYYGVDTSHNLFFNLLESTIPDTAVPIPTYFSDERVAQYPTMPEIGLENFGQIVQYVGETDSNYTHGYFYKANGQLVSTDSSIDFGPLYNMETMEEIPGNSVSITPENLDILVNAITRAGLSEDIMNSQWEYDAVQNLLVIDATSTRIGINLNATPGLITFTETPTVNVTWVASNYTPGSQSLQNTSWGRIDVQPTGSVSITTDTSLQGAGTTESPLGISTATMATINGKQDALTAEQLAAVNSGITSAKVANYDAYAGEISAKVNIAQGADNAGKILGIGADGNVTPVVAPNSGAATLLYYDSTQAPDHSHAMSGVSLEGYGLAGYEVYSNGYVRQWGQDSTSTGTTSVTLPISYTAATTVSMSFFVSVTEVAAAPTGQISAIPVAANQFQVDKPSAICNWETSGYITLS